MRMFDFEVPVNDVIHMAVVRSTLDLPSELARNSLPESSMRDDVVEHLVAVNIFEYHRVMMLVNDHFAHTYG